MIIPLNLRRLFAGILSLWSAEILLARSTSLPQTWEDMALSAGVLLLWSLLALGAFKLLRKTKGGNDPEQPLPRAAVIAITVLAMVPVAVIAQGILSPIHTAYRGMASTLFGFVPALIGVAVGLLGLWSSRNPFPVPAFIGVMLVVTPLPVWIWEGWPPITRVLFFAAGTAVIIALGSSRIWPILLPIGLVIGRWPLPEPIDEWKKPSAILQKPDVILITVDTLRSDAAQTMETWRRLSAQGTAFPHSQASAPWTLPSLASILTGLPFMDHGAQRLPNGNFSVIDQPVASLAEILLSEGYDTAAALAGNPYVRKQLGFKRGFEVFDHLTELSWHPLPRGRAVARLSIPKGLSRRGLWPERAAGSSELVLSRALTILEKRRERPIFLWIHLLDCHLPYRHARTAPLPWRKRVALSGLSRKELLMETYKLDNEDILTAYRHEVQVTDRDLMRFLDALGPPPDRGRIVVFTSDHGEEFLDHGAYEHGHTVYQELISVPLVFTGPGFEPGAIELPSGLNPAQIDIAPTILGAVGAPKIGKGVDLRHRRGVGRMVVSGSLLYGGPDSVMSVRKDDWKAIFPKDGRPRLYNIAQDPKEQTEVDDLDIIVLLRDATEFSNVYGQTLTMDKGTEDALKALGYVD